MDGMAVAPGFRRRRMKRQALFLLIAAFLLNLVYNASLPLHFDEAYYWVWSRHLQLSYFDHPPLIAWLIRLTTLLGDAEWQIRLVPLCCLSLTGLFLYGLARDLFGGAVAERALWIFLLSPLAQMGFSLATPDAPLILGWAATIYFAQKAVFGGDSRWYYAAGIAAGFAVLAKYTAVLLLPGLLAALLCARRRELRRFELYAAIGMAMIMFVPVLIWNAGHDWSSFRFQLGHGLASTKVFNPATFLEYWGAQAIGLNPLFFLAFLYLLARRLPETLRDDRQSFLLWPCLSTLAFFGYAALFKRAEGNWAAPAHVTGIVLLAKWLDRPQFFRIYKAGIALGVILILILKVPEMFDFLPRQLVMKRLVVGYDQMFAVGGRYVTPATAVIAGDYKLASLACYYLPGHPTVRVVTPARFSQYDYWRTENDLSADSEVVFFGDYRQAAYLTKLFREVEPLPALTWHDRNISREIAVYRCRSLLVTNDPSSDFPPSRSDFGPSR